MTWLNSDCLWHTQSFLELEQDEDQLNGLNGFHFFIISRQPTSYSNKNSFAGWTTKALACGLKECKVRITIDITNGAMRVISPPGNIGISKSMTWSVGVPFSIKQYRYIQYDTSYVIEVDTKNDYGVLIDCHYLCKTVYHGNLSIPELQVPLASSSPSFSEGLIFLFPSRLFGCEALERHSSVECWQRSTMWTPRCRKCMKYWMSELIYPVIQDMFDGQNPVQRLKKTLQWIRVKRSKQWKFHHFVVVFPIGKRWDFQA